MKRREALKLTATILGGSVIGSQVFLSGCSTPKGKLNVLTEDDLPLLDEIGETILPDSEQSPGAMAAHIGKFMQTMVNDCYDKKETAIFIKGLRSVEQKSNH